MKHISKTILAALAIGLLSCGLLSQQAQAAPITGDINFVGAVNLDNTDLSLATAVNHWIVSVVGLSSGDLTVPVLTPVTMHEPYVFVGPTDDLWSVNGFTFDLASATVVSQSVNFLNVLGTGTISAAGFDDTPGTWSFTISNADGKTHLAFGFQANTTAVVPDGGTTVMLLGAALGVLGIARRALKR